MAALRLTNPFRPLTRNEKIGIGLAGGALLATATIATVVWASKSDPEPPKKAIHIGPACTTFAILSEQQLRDDLRAHVRAAVKRGPIDPFAVTAKYVRAISPGCVSYPGNAQNPGQVKLFAAVFSALLELMKQENFLTDADAPTWYGMMATWSEGQGVPAEDL